MSWSATSGARPFFLLSHEPCSGAVFLYKFKVWFHCPMMRPFVIHESIKLSAWKVVAKTTGNNAFFFGTFSEVTFFYILINKVTTAAITIRCSTRSAVKSAWSKLFWLHFFFHLGITTKIRGGLQTVLWIALDNIKAPL